MSTSLFPPDDEHTQWKKAETVANLMTWYRRKGSWGRHVLWLDAVWWCKAMLETLLLVIWGLVESLFVCCGPLMLGCVAGKRQCAWNRVCNRTRGALLAVFDLRRRPVCCALYVGPFVVRRRGPQRRRSTLGGLPLLGWGARGEGVGSLSRRKWWWRLRRISGEVRRDGHVGFGVWLKGKIRASLRFKKRLNFSINLRKLSIFYWYFSNRSEAQEKMWLKRTCILGGSNGRDPTLGWSTGTRWGALVGALIVSLCRPGGSATSLVVKCSRAEMASLNFRGCCRPKRTLLRQPCRGGPTNVKGPGSSVSLWTYSPPGELRPSQTGDECIVQRPAICKY